MAGTHFIVDGYSNIYAPLLPLLIPQLQMSLFVAGTLQMCFQIANSVAQLAFGHIADHWRPRVLVIAPSRSRTFLLFIHPCHPRNPWSSKRLR